MKNSIFFTILCFLLASISVNGQTQKGQTLVGIGTTFNSFDNEMLFSSMSNIASAGITSIKFKSDENNDEDPTKSTQINFSPKVGKFVKDDLVIGAEVNYSFSGSKNEYDEYESKRRYNLICVGPFIRYYFPANNAKFYAEAGWVYGSIMMKSIFSSPNTESENKSTTQITGFNGGLGVAFPLGKNATFDVLGGYSSITFKDKDDNPNNARGVVGHWGLKIGFNVFLNGKSSAD